MANRYNLAELYVPCGETADGFSENVLVALQYVDKTWRLAAWRCRVKNGLVYAKMFDNGFTEKPLFAAARYTSKGMEKAMDAFREGAEAFAAEAFPSLVKNSGTFAAQAV